MRTQDADYVDMCARCKIPYGVLQPYVARESDSKDLAKDPLKKPGIDHNSYMPSIDLVKYTFLDPRGGQPVYQSSRTSMALTIVQRWQTDAPDDKIIGESFHANSSL